jgi:hypothetical protein
LITHSHDLCCLQWGVGSKQVKYLTNGRWLHADWLNSWRRCGRLFAHNDVNTNNHVESFWHRLKYSVLQGRVNRSFTELVTLILGSFDDLMLRQQQDDECSKYSTRMSAENRLRAQRSTEIAAEAGAVTHVGGLDFSVISSSDPQTTYHVSLAHDLCDCPANVNGRRCKHLLACRLVLQRDKPLLFEQVDAAAERSVVVQVPQAKPAAQVHVLSRVICSCLSCSPHSSCALC